MNLTAIGEKLTDTKLLELAPEFNAKMVRIMDAVGYIQKDATLKGGTFSYKYASAEVVLGKVREECSKEGISVTNEASLEAFHIVGAKSLAVVKETLYFTDGFFIAKAEGLGSGIDAGDKAVMKGNTSAMKYACSGKFLISWGDDPEASGEDEDMTAVDHWLSVCEQASNTTAAKFAPWWKKSGEQVKKECGVDGAAKVYEAYQTYLARLKAEAEPAVNMDAE